MTIVVRQCIKLTMKSANGLQGTYIEGAKTVTCVLLGAPLGEHQEPKGALSLVQVLEPLAPKRPRLLVPYRLGSAVPITRGL